ncbi:MAG: sensor domain-containing diguanylate cyclase, partial [Sporomusaceae bacterium]|nr:sensor domain-containing diguanylate cyclase [Sporomusaceae bacterium]
SITAQYQNVNEELYTAMSNQDLFLMDLEQTKKQLVALYRITSIVQKTVDEEEVLEEILKNVTKEFALDNVAILLLDKENQELVVRAHTGYFQTFCKFLRIPLGQGIAGHAAKYREVVFSPDVSQDHRYISGGIDCVSELAIPLIVNDQVIGVFDIETTCKRDFSELELEMFGSLANQIAMTIAHANHVASVEVQAITDGMTGLFNYRYFRTLLTQEFKRSKRYHRPLSLLMMDIDNFKSYNDRHGHQQGDYLLRTIAELIRHIVRDVDFVVRYGGEEFAVILPETPLHDAVIIAERIRQSIAEYPFDNRETQPNGIISVSTGLASFPRDADSDVELIQHADAAMYAAKQNDKNCVRVFHEIAAG